MAKNKKSKEKPTDETKIKNTKLFLNYLKVVEQFITGKNYSPMSSLDLREKLSILPVHHEILEIVLAELIKKKVIKLSGDRYIACVNVSEIVSGIIRMHVRGFGFVQPDDPISYPQDIFIPKHLTKNAVDGDQVEVIINPHSFSEKGPEGKVIAITSRGRTHLAGIIAEINADYSLVYVPLLGSEKRVLLSDTKEELLRFGDRIVMEVIDWGSDQKDTICRFSHKIGNIDDPSCDIEAAVEEYGIRSDFPHAVIEEAQSFGKTVSKKEIANRLDLRDTECFTIDPDTAKDFDDAVNISQDTQGNYHLGVHIADVSHYVKPNSALDSEATKRCNSTYFPGRCIPMLPPALSENLCSLKPKVNRLTVSVLMTFDPTGEMIDYRIVRSVIKSAHRFTYKEAKLVLDQKKKSVHSEALQLMVKVCQLLKKKRYQRGSVEFAMPELVVMVDDKGVPYKTDYIEYDITHQLVEEFMLKANETVAKHLDLKGKGLPYRVHDEPSEDNLKDFAAMATAFGFHLPAKPTPSDIQKMFDQALKSPFGQYLATSYIRRMRLAVYSPTNIGHYGLALTHYCHFTSPIRRYVDLVAHRLLFESPIDIKELEEISLKCSEQERISSKAENSVVLLKKLRLLSTYQKQEPYKQYEAIITKVKPFGIYFEVLDLLLEGFIHISEIGQDFYIYDEKSKCLRGERHKENYHSGEKIFVMLKSIDFIGLECLWHMVGNAKSDKKSFKKSKKHIK
ncbi:Ribonuclease R [Chlamydiales bacterium STE3]|nr:Ribonuclease R [Chlamydiales bacterium STE3]